MYKPHIVKKLEEKLGIELSHLSQLEAYMKDNYPPSYLEVMSQEEEMAGSMYSKYAFTDQEGRLIGLNLFNCGLQSHQLDFLRDSDIDLSHLKTLNLAQNKLTTFSLSIKMTSLRVAKLSDNKELGVFGLDAACTRLARLELMGGKLEELILPDTLHELYYLDVSKNADLKYMEFEGGLESLQVLFVRGTAISEISFQGAFPELHYLYLNANKLEKLRVEQPFPKLRTLQLRNNQLKNFSEQHIQLGEEMVANKDFWTSFHAYFPSIQAVFVGENPIDDAVLATKLVDEKASNNIRTLRAHFEQRKAGVDKDNECKVLLIGNGSAGKTNILNRLHPEREFNDKWDSTHGIKIEKYEMDSYVLYFWDFGGQDIYHSTHRLFMQKDAVYILAWKKKTETESQTQHDITQTNGKPDTRFYTNFKLRYWLDYARQLGEKSPMLVVQTNIAADGRITDKLSGLKDTYEKSFPGMFEFLHVESDPQQDGSRSYRRLERSIGQAVTTIKDSRSDSGIAVPLLKLRDYIRDLQVKEPEKKFMDLTEYEKVARDFGVIDPMLQLKTWLFRTGVVYFREGVFNNQVVLDQTWAINAIYALFDRSDTRLQEISENRGEFSGAKLREIWAKDYPESEVQELLLGFMKECDICYELEVEEKHPSFEQRKFVAPKLLPSKKPLRQWEKGLKSEIHQSPASHYVKLSYRFLHEKVIEGILARTAYLADEEWLMWQSGTRISEAGGVLYVERVRDELLICFNKQGFSLFAKLRELIEELEDEQPELLLSKDGLTYEPLKEGSSEEQAIKSYFMMEGMGGELLLKERYRGEIAPTEEKDASTSKTKLGFDREAKQPKKEIPKGVIREMIEDNEMKEAAKLLSKYLSGEAKNQLSIITRRIHTLEVEFNKGTLDFDEAEKERNKAASSLLTLLDGGSVEVEETIETGKVEKKVISKSNETKSEDGGLLRYIQFLSASPEGWERTGADHEYKELKAKYREGSKRENLKFMEMELSLDLDALMRITHSDQLPHIMHFSGHGTQEGIQLMGPQNEAVPLRDNHLKTLCRRLQHRTEVVLLNACHSSHQAKIISEFDMHVIGTNSSVLEKAAILFSKSFYAALANGQPLQIAFEDGRMKVEEIYPKQAHTFEVWYNGQQLNW